MFVYVLTVMLSDRSLFELVLATVKPRELWIADRARCTSGFLRDITKPGSRLVIRRHKSLSLEAVSELYSCGETPGWETI